MSSWGNNDNAANAPYWAVSSISKANAPTAAAPTSANVELLYANTTADAYTTGLTVGVFGVDAQESSAQNKVHTGWVLKTTGSGGRAGRVQQEVLVAMSNMGADGVDGDAQVYANVTITLTNPSNGLVGASSTNVNSAIFTVGTSLDGNTAATLSYQWQVNSNTGSLGWTNVANNTPTATKYSGGTTDTLYVIPYNATANAYVVRAVVTAADEGVVATSANATVTIVPGV